MTDQILTASTVEDFAKVFEQAEHAIGSYGYEGNDVAHRLAGTISRRIKEMILDEMECLRALVAEQEQNELIEKYENTQQCPKCAGCGETAPWDSECSFQCDKCNGEGVVKVAEQEQVREVAP